MPTDDDTLLPPLVRASSLRSAHATCPPEIDSTVTATFDVNSSRGNANSIDPSRAEQDPLPVPGEEQPPSSGATEHRRPPAQAHTARGHDGGSAIQRDSPSPMDVIDHTRDDPAMRAHPAGSVPKLATPFPTPLRGPEASSRPMPQHTSSYLHNGSRFAGTQQSDRQVYNVSVEIKHVDMRESFICGYLRIEGLTPEHATLTTYFEGEIIGTKYTFQTRHAEWGSNEKVDMAHWYRFPAWRPLAKQARKPDFSYKNYVDREHLFMRWKEYFLVPDHRVTSINGASFEGFYYICFNQISGTVSGIYFHSKSEKYQQLELKHVHDYGCKGALEFA